MGRYAVSLDWRRTPAVKGCFELRVVDVRTRTRMSNPISASKPIFSSATIADFIRYLQENPNSRRISLEEQENIVRWLTDPLQRPSSQKEFSRRNYVRKTFAWDENAQRLSTAGKVPADGPRFVVTENDIVDVVASVHESNGHLGWDATWRDVSTKYYGILRSDVIHLLKQCPQCAQDPSKRPKSIASSSGYRPFEPQVDALVQHPAHQLDDGTSQQEVDQDDICALSCSESVEGHGINSCWKQPDWEG